MSELSELLTRLVNARIEKEGSTPTVMGGLLQATGLSRAELSLYLDGKATAEDILLSDLRDMATFLDAPVGDLLEAAMNDGLLTDDDDDEREPGAPIRQVIPAEQYAALVKVRDALQAHLATDA